MIRWRRTSADGSNATVSSAGCVPSGRAATNMGIEVVPLESRSASDASYAVGRARFILVKGRGSIEAETAQIRQASPAAYDIVSGWHADALGLLRRPQNDRDRLLRMIRKLGGRRNAQMLAAINATAPNMVIVGNNHANFLKDALPAFNYISILTD